VEVIVMARKSCRLFHLSATTILVALLVTSSVAQKGPESTRGAPLKGVDVKLGKNPGGSPAARTTDSDGKIHFAVLEKGSYYLVVVVPQGDAESAAVDDAYLVKIKSTVGDAVEWLWRIKKHDASMAAIQNIRARGAKPPEFQDRITFNSDGVTPTEVTIIKSKSNISNNRSNQ
jgi:hypothetical protein